MQLKIDVSHFVMLDNRANNELYMNFTSFNI